LRSLAARRDFCSTRVDTNPYDSQLLDRKWRSEQLDPAHAQALMKVIRAMARHEQAAGWAVHLVLNAHATLGAFEVPNLVEIAEKAQLNSGLISAAITYEPCPETWMSLSGKLSGPDAHEALLRHLGEGIPVDGVVMLPPRFLAVSDPWQVRDRWGVPTDILEKLGLPTDPDQLVGEFRSRRDAAIAIGATESSVDLVLVRLSRGDTMLLLEAEKVMTTREPPVGVDGELNTTGLLVIMARELDLALRLF
jgi:hypothetical protein